MSKEAQVVDGEASESDSELELEIGKSPESEMTPTGEPFVIPGEAPESDDESKISSVSRNRELEDINIELPTTPYPTAMTMYNSLLHQKLWECNISLRATVEGLLKHTTEIAVDKLSRADKTLLSVQESMRATNANLTLARARLKQIHTALENANCATAFPTVKARQMTDA